MFRGGRQQKSSGRTGVASDAKRRVDQCMTQSTTLRPRRDRYRSKERSVRIHLERSGADEASLVSCHDNAGRLVQAIERQT